MIVYPARDIPPFVMYCVNGKPRSSLLIESKRVARGGSGGGGGTPPHSRKGPQNLRTICIVHVGDDDLARSGVYVRTCR